MEIGTIGAGAFVQAFAKRALKARHRVKLSNSRGPDSLREIVDQLGPEAMAATKDEAAACEMVLLAVPWDNVPETLASLPRWKNQILIDGTNPFHGGARNAPPQSPTSATAPPSAGQTDYHMKIRDAVAFVTGANRARSRAARGLRRRPGCIGIVFRKSPV